MTLNKEEIEILYHTLNKASGKRYCGGSEAMDSLVSKGFMKYLGRIAFVPDPYYTITAEGMLILERSKHANS